MKFKFLTILSIVLLGTFLRFYNLNWGAPFYFHPDERQNIAYPILTSKSIFMLDQNNFDTGTFPLTVMKIIFSFINNNFHKKTPLDQLQLVILISRFLSAIISIGILFFLFHIVKKIFGATKAFIALLLATFSVGFIQFSHFGTVELWEALFFLLLFFYSWRISKYNYKTDGIVCGILFGLATATKILSIILIPTILTSFIYFIHNKPYSKNKLLSNVKKTIPVFLFFIFSAIVTFAITSLPLIENFSAASNSIHFESEVALGKISVFYTRSFVNTIPVIFQFTKIYPLLLNPFISILFIFSFISIIFLGFKNRNYAYLLLAIYYLLLFGVQSFFFVKWTRYMIPTLPFIYMIIGIAIDDWLKNLKEKTRNMGIFADILIMLIVIISFTFTLAFFSIYTHPDVRVTASNWIENTLPQNSTVLVESGNVIDIPLKGNFNRLSLDFYDIDTDIKARSDVVFGLNSSDYFIIQSRRVFMNYQRLPNIYPVTANFYSKLFSGKLGFTQIKEFNSYPMLQFGNWKIEFPDETAEETWSVFDHPVIRIFKKTKQLSIEEYEKFLEI